MMQEVDPSELHKFLINLYAEKIKQPEMTYYKVVDLDTGRLAGCTGLSMPIAEPPAEKHPPMPQGIQEKLAGQFFGVMLGRSKNFGFDPTKHCHRVGTFVHPDYQRQGVGTLLTRHCNKVADEAGFPTYVGAASTSAVLFRKEGFQEIDCLETKIEDFGGPKGVDRSYVLLRPLQSEILAK
ncbi:hypothetical protein F5884DRAFT_789029 [Xylogone sp. PMI_703]|nr:hypothetical protein F5884DRAFT_789029 [Xylogone sp. PMI_703]